MFIGADAFIFAVLFASFMQERLGAPAVFEASRQTLNASLGGLDTLILLTSSWMVALAIQALKSDRLNAVPGYLFGAVSTGLLFVASKSFEYFQELAQGITPLTDAFYTWYFILTGVHLLHVLIGTGLLVYVLIKAKQRAYSASSRAVPECVASFWHLVDLLWIVLFPLLYLMKAA